MSDEDIFQKYLCAAGTFTQILPAKTKVFNPRIEIFNSGTAKCPESSRYHRTEGQRIARAAEKSGAAKFPRPFQRQAKAGNYYAIFGDFAFNQRPDSERRTRRPVFRHNYQRDE